MSWPVVLVGCSGVVWLCQGRLLAHALALASGWASSHHVATGMPRGGHSALQGRCDLSGHQDQALCPARPTDVAGVSPWPHVPGMLCQAVKPQPGRWVYLGLENFFVWKTPSGSSQPFYTPLGCLRSPRGGLSCTEGLILHIPTELTRFSPPGRCSGGSPPPPWGDASPRHATA